MSDSTHSPAPHDASSNLQPKVPAPKDRNCPYCHQAFTSSSLGRHLDLYIKPRNPKPPDGIHDVEEIRRIRGNITRRQARMSGIKKRQSLPPPNPSHLSAHNSSQSIAVDTTVPRTAGCAKSVLGEQGTLIQSPSSADAGTPRTYGILLNRLNWLATGVINDLPPREDPLQRVKSKPQAQARSGSEEVVTPWRSESREAEREMQTRLLDQLDRGKAADLALREVLSSVTEANSQNLFQNLFNGLNLFELDFPQLVLHLLPHPPTLFNQHPFPSPDSWFVDPPDQKHYDALQRLIHDHISLIRNQRKLARRPSRNDSAIETATNGPGTDAKEERLLSHIFEAWRHWNTLDSKTRQQTWTLSILRSYTRAETARKEASATMDVLRKQVEHLAAELAKASNDYSMWRDKGLPPSTILTNMRLSNETLVSIYRQGVDVRNWDYDGLVGKWKGVVKDERESLVGRRVMSEAEARREGSSEDESEETNGVRGRSGSLGSEMHRNGSMDDEGDEEDEEERIQVDTGQRWQARNRQNGLGVSTEDHSMEGT